MKTKTSAYRLQYIDWLRGLGAIIMLQGHVFDSFLRSDLRGRRALRSLAVRGRHAAGHLPVPDRSDAGVPDGFSTERKGMPPASACSTAFRRSGYLFFLAFAFRAATLDFRSSRRLGPTCSAWTS